jgi:hypothetical protein
MTAADTAAITNLRTIPFLLMGVYKVEFQWVRRWCSLWRSLSQASRMTGDR